MKRACLAFALFALLSLTVRADELHLKDGTKITGTIVGYQGTSFRVKTSYGYALVERASVASITVSDPTAKAMEHKAGVKTETPNADIATKTSATPASAASATKTEKSTTPTTAANPQNRAQQKTESAGNSPPTPSSKSAASAPTQNAQSVPQSSGASALNATTATPATAAIPAVADPAPAPIPVREEVHDNVYINETYGFQIYRPPDWQLIDGARAALPGAIAALGTADQTTYLIIGLESTNDTFEAHVTTTNDRLSDTFYNFRPGTLRQTLIAGLPACEYQFQGMADNKLWSGTVALIRRGENIFTAFGVTAASSDLVQIQQNVISRAIASLQFSATK